MDLHVIRHTRLDIDDGRCYGQAEVPLAASFDSELAKLRERVAPRYDAVISSPAQRCTQLARHFGESFETDERLLEYDFGDWEMQRWDDIERGDLDAWMQDFVHLSPPNGETLVDMAARVGALLEQLRQCNHESCLLVTHAGVIRCIWAHLLSIPLEQIFKLDIGYGGVMRCRLGVVPQEDAVFPHAID